MEYGGDKYENGVITQDLLQCSMEEDGIMIETGIMISQDNDGVVIGTQIMISKEVHRRMEGVFGPPPQDGGGFGPHKSFLEKGRNLLAGHEQVRKFYHAPNPFTLSAVCMPLTITRQVKSTAQNPQHSKSVHIQGRISGHSCTRFIPGISSF